MTVDMVLTNRSGSKLAIASSAVLSCRRKFWKLTTSSGSASPSSSPKLQSAPGAHSIFLRIVCRSDVKKARLSGVSARTSPFLAFLCCRAAATTGKGRSVGRARRDVRKEAEERARTRLRMSSRKPNTAELVSGASSASSWRNSGRQSWSMASASALVLSSASASAATIFPSSTP